MTPSADVVELATALSTAVRIEPTLIRAVRLEIFPSLDVGVEADLWFSDLVHSRAPRWITLRPDVREALQARLKLALQSSGTAPRWHRIGDLLARAHGRLSPALALEEAVTWNAVAEGAAQVDQLLEPALRALLVEERRGIAAWYAGAWERFPQGVRHTRVAWQLAQVTDHLVPDTALVPVTPPALTTDWPAGIADALPDVLLGVRREGTALEVGELGDTSGAALIRTLRSDPWVLEVQSGDGSTSYGTIVARLGGQVRVEVGRDLVRLRTPRGAVYSIPPPSGRTPPVRERAGELSQNDRRGIEHVVVLVLDGRSFDHMLGYLDHPDPGFEGLRRGGPFTNPGWNGGPPVPATPSASRVLPLAPGRSFDAVLEQLALTGTGPTRRATNQGFVRSYERTGRGFVPPAFGGALAPVLNNARERDPGEPISAGLGPLIMGCQPVEHVPVLSRLALEFAVCDRWFASVPGETLPNRNFLHAATSDGETNVELRPYVDRTIFELLEDHGHDWRIYHGVSPCSWAFPRLWDTPERHARWFSLGTFAEHVAAGDLPAYAFLEAGRGSPLPSSAAPGGRAVDPALSSSQDPADNLVPADLYDDFPEGVETDFARGERLVASVYEALRCRPDLFARTVLLVTYSEHGGFFDHVPPPGAVPSSSAPRAPASRLLGVLWNRKAGAFDFTMLGPRVPAVVISPLVPAGTVDRRLHDHASVPATLRTLFAPSAAPLTRRDAWSPTFADLVTLEQPRRDLPDLSAHTVAAAPPENAASGRRSAALSQVSSHRPWLLSLADQVQSRLAAAGEPELAALDSVEGPERAAEITAAFAAAAHRHRSR